MDTKWLMGIPAIVCLGAPGIAYAMPPQVKLADSNAQCDGPTHIPIIEVEGKARAQYGSVKTRELWACIAMNTDDQGPPANRGTVDSSVTVESTTKPANSSSGWRYYTVPFAYIGPLSTGGTYRMDPVEMCNDLADSKSGQARRRFIRQGDYITVDDAFRVTGKTTWKIRRSSNPYNPDFHRTRHQPFERAIRVKALIRCLPTNNFATTSSNTSTTSTLPPGTVPTSRRTPGGADPADRTNPSRRTTPRPTVKPVSLTLAPANMQTVGRWQCPRTLRLRGRVDVRRAFEGKAIFVGEQWLSRSIDLDFSGESGRYVTASYPLEWSVGGLASNANTAPRKQLSFTFNVSDKNGVLKRTERKNIAVICKRS